MGQTGRVSSLMINKASEALVELITDEDLSRGAVFPGRVLFWFFYYLVIFID